jgi:hypothetical protein
MRRFWLLPALLVVSASCSDGGSSVFATPAVPPVAESWQRTVDGLRDLQGSLEIPDHLLEPGAVRNGTEFDVEQYFAILDRLDVEPGFVLDFVYCLGTYQGYPILYVRRTDEPGYTTCDAYRAAVGSDGDEQGGTGYLSRIRVDGSPEGFFQYVVLRIMGGQFYLHWHALEDDAQVVATGTRLEEALASVAGEMDEAEVSRARAADPTPRVSFGSLEDFGGEVAIVEVLAFTRWGGLLRHTYTISREFPHRFLGVDVETVAECDCAIMF